jgi:hypothetical protein
MSSSKKKSPSLLSVPPQRVALAADSPKENSASKSKLPNVATMSKTTPVQPKRERMTGVKRAQMEALQAFGGKSLGNVLSETPATTQQVPKAVNSDTRVAKMREKRQQEAMAQFGGDLDTLTNEVKDKIMEASMKHIQEKELSQQAIIRNKVNLKKQNTWGKDLAEVDFKPGLSRVERERLEYLEAQKALKEAAAPTESPKCAEEREAKEAEARVQREAERVARAEERKQAELEKKRRIEQAKEERRAAKLAPFMQQQKEAEKIESVPAAPEITAAPVAVEVIAQIETIAPTETVAPVEEASVASETLEVAPVESPVEASPIPEKEANDEDVEECHTPNRVYKTAVSSLCGSPADAATDESMGELLDQISIGDLSVELTPNCSMTAKSDDDVMEIQSSLQKRKTPIVRQPFYDAPQITEELRGALEELAQQNENREEALLASMRDSLNGWTVKELKEELKGHGLKVSGLKSELIDRLIEFRKTNKTAGGDKCAIM